MIIDLDKLDRVDIIGLLDLKISDLDKKKTEVQKRRQELTNAVRGLTDEELGTLISAKQNEIDAIDAEVTELKATKGKI